MSDERLAEIDRDAHVDQAIDALLEAGVVLLDEQIDFVRQPEDRTAVIVLGIADPNCLYIRGPDYAPTMYQIANPGEPCDVKGNRACVLPVVMQGMDFLEGIQTVDNYIGYTPTALPTAIGYLTAGSDWLYRWMGDEYPWEAVAFDLWPIPADQVDVWEQAAAQCYGESRMEPLWELISWHYSGEDMDLGDDEVYKLNEAMYDAHREGDNALASRLSEELATRVDAAVGRLESEVLHPITGEVDPQFPPLQLPPELDAIWSSLQALSQQNWNLLAKQVTAASDAPGGLAEFEESNRRLCPWY